MQVIDIAEYLEKIYEHREKFDRFRNILLEFNRKFNLTSLTEEKEILYKHFLDSVLGESLFPKNANIVEVGSGAGFPSIPLKILREDLHFSLIESTGKKCEFLKIATKTLNLSEIKIYNLRAEDAGKNEIFREKYEICCARAVARLNTLLEYCLPLIKIDGKMIAYKGCSEEEIEEAKKAISILGGKLEQVLHYSLPENSGERTLIVIRKIRNTPQKYPRGKGKERSDPIR